MIRREHQLDAAGPDRSERGLAYCRRLCDITDEWWGGSGGWKGKINHLTNGGGKNGTTVLDATTVFDDAAIDDLRGGHGKDWFLARTTGLFADDLDADKNEIVTEI